MLFARNAQEAADLAVIARRVAEASDTPFMVAQDGFLTTHTLENVLLPEDDLMREFVGDPRDHIRDLFDPAEALMTGVVQNQDSYMKGRIGQRAYTDRLPAILADAYGEFERLTGRHYGPVDAYRTEDAREIMVSMGTMADTAIAVVDHLRAQGRPVGCVAVTAFRPFPSAALVAVLEGARAVGIVERTDDPLAAANPLMREVQSALYAGAAEGGQVPRMLSISAGLGSRDIAAGDLVAIFDRLGDQNEPQQRHLVVGIRHPLALPAAAVDLRPEGAYSLRGHSIGGFGSVTTNKLVATLAGELFGKQVQAYPRYGSEKKGLPTTYYLTIADAPIRLHSELDQVEFVPLHDVSAFGLGDPLAGLADGGDVFIQSPLTEPEFDLGIDPVVVPGRDPRPGDPGDRARYGGPRSPACASRGVAGSDAGGRACRRVPAGLAVRGPGRHGSRDPARCRSRSPRPVLREARRSGRRCQPRGHHGGFRWPHRCHRRHRRPAAEVKGGRASGARHGGSRKMTASSIATTVGDRMALEPVVIRADASLTEAAALMDRHHVHGLPVVDPAGSLVGVLSQTDLARARVTEYLWSNWPGLAVRHLMTSPAITIYRASGLDVAARKMERHRIHRLVVVDDDDPTIPIGVLSTTDLIHAIAEELAQGTGAPLEGATDA